LELLPSQNLVPDPRPALSYS